MTMKKMIAIFAMVAALGANAFWNNNNTPWNNGYNTSGYQSDNGMFGYNPYDYWDPRWYMEEMSNMVDEIDDEINSNSNNGYGYNPYSNGPWNNNTPWNRTAPAAVK
jgi:hypothetical protein